MTCRDVFRFVGYVLMFDILAGVSAWIQHAPIQFNEAAQLAVMFTIVSVIRENKP